MSQLKSRLIVPADVNAPILVMDEGLSFWGGVDPDTGRVIDAHHPLHGQSLADKIVMMPTSRGSCSGSGVLLQLALNDQAPAALIFREDEDILTLGALIADKMFDRSVGIIHLTPDSYDCLAQYNQAKLAGTQIIAQDQVFDLHPVSAEDLSLSTSDHDKLNGEAGGPAQLAMEVMIAIAASQGAQQLLDVTRGHIDGCIYAHDANRIFAEKMADMGAKVAIPTTINAISVERDHWDEHGLPPNFADAARRLADAYVTMGAQNTFTCAPYLLDDAPETGDDIGWSESNAVIFANSVLGARTAKHPDYLDLFIAMTGRAPNTGVYLTENRRPRLIIDVDAPNGADDALWPLLGWLTGRLAPDRIPLLRGLAHLKPSTDDLKALCAAFGTTSAAPMLHVDGVTPEADLTPTADAEMVQIAKGDFRNAWDVFNEGAERIDLIALGSPHFSFEETKSFAELMKDKKVHEDVSAIITLGKEAYQKTLKEGLVDALQTSGVRLICDICWCSVVEPIFPVHAKNLMTNSGKYAHYAPGLVDRTTRFGSLSDCANAAVSGFAKKNVPDWMI